MPIPRLRAPRFPLRPARVGVLFALLAGLVAMPALLTAQTAVLSYNWESDPVTTNRNFSRGWAAGTTVDRIISFSDSLALSPTTGYAGPAFYGAASYRLQGTTDGTTPIAVAGTPVARVTNATSGDEIYASITSGSLAAGGTASVQAAALYYFKSGTAFPLGDTSLRYTVGTYSNLSRFQWVLRDAGGSLFVSDMSIKIPNAGSSFLSNNLTTRRWAPLNPSLENLLLATGSYQFPAQLGLDFNQITGAGVMVTLSRSGSNSGNFSFNAAIRKFEAFAHDPVRDANQFSAYYCGNSLTASTYPAGHPALGASAGKTWENSTMIGAGWQLWQHRYQLFVSGDLGSVANGDYTLDPGLVGDSNAQNDAFVTRPWEALVLQQFGGVMWDEVVTEKWQYTFPEPTNVGDPQSATDLINLYLSLNPAGRIFIYTPWHGMGKGIVPPYDEWPAWTQTYNKASELIPGQLHGEFPDRDAFVFDDHFFDFYQMENPPWTNDRNSTRDYRHKLFAELVNRFPELWAGGRLAMIPTGEVFRRLDQIYRAGGDPELNNPAVAEKITRVADLYADSLHVRGGVTQFLCAAAFYTSFFGEHPGALDWSLYNDPANWGTDPTHDATPILLITEARAQQICDTLWEVFRNHPFTAIRHSPFQSNDPAQPDTALLWGANSHGQVGKANYPASITSPQALTTGISVYPGGEFSLGIKPDGSVLGWGRNHRGQLGDTTTVPHAFPYANPLLPPALSLACGTHHAAAVTAAGEIWAWGANDSGQLGDDFGRFGHQINGFPVPPENGRARKVNGLPAGGTQVACGDGFVLGRFADGSVWAWGNNGRGQLAVTGTANRSTPQAISGLPSINQIAAGDAFALALAADGTVWAWGANDRGQLGLGHQNDTPTPTQIAGLSAIAKIVAGGSHAAAIAQNGTLYLWGDNALGQLGADPAATPFRANPAALDLGNAADQVALGTAHTLALLADRVLYSWGDNSIGQLGDGTANPRWGPAAVPGADRIASIRARGSQSHAFTAPPRPTFSAWQSQRFTPQEIAAGDADPTGDFDRDRHVNLIEYLLGRDPRAADHAPPFQMRVEGGRMIVEADYLYADLGAGVFWEKSGDLTHWVPVVPAWQERIRTGDIEHAEIHLDLPPDASRLFLRLRATMAP